MFSYEEIHGGDNYVPYTSLDPLNDPKSFTFRIKVHFDWKMCVAYVINFHGFWDFIKSFVHSKISLKMRLIGLLLTLTNISQSHDINDINFDSKVRELGTPAMALFEPAMATKKATFGMSWFWFPEAQFGSTKGIIRTRVGYAGGTKVNPSYYSLGDHTETVDVDYDPSVTNYAELLKLFWNNHDPCTRQKRQYMSAIFYHDEEQKALAEQTMEEQKSKKSKAIATQILPATEFYVAEEWVSLILNYWLPCEIFLHLFVAVIIKNTCCNTILGFWSLWISILVNNWSARTWLLVLMDTLADMEKSKISTPKVLNWASMKRWSNMSLEKWQANSKRKIISFTILYCSVIWQNSLVS